MAIADKLQQLAEDAAIIYDEIDDIRLAINAQGVNVPAGTPLAAFPDAIAAIETGGGGTSGGDITNMHIVKYIDSDGSILKEEAVANGGSAKPPQNPSRPYLTFTGWQGGSLINIVKEMVFGANYDTSNGDTFFFITIPVGALYMLFLTKDTTDTMNIDWGDGINFNVSNSGALNYSHTYAAGSYIVRISCSGKHVFGSGSSTGTFRNNVGGNANSIINKAYFGRNAYLLGNSMSSWKNATDVVLSNGVTNAAISNIFDSVPNLKAVVLPNSVTKRLSVTNCYNLEYYILSPCDLASIFIDMPGALKYINLEASTGQYFGFSNDGGVLNGHLDVPEGTLYISNDGFYLARIRSVKLPSTLLTINDRAFYATLLESIDIPASVTSTGSNAFGGLYCLKKIISRNPIPPAFSSTLTMDSRTPVLKIYVPDASVDAYKAASGWSTYASYIFPLSQYQE